MPHRISFFGPAMITLGAMTGFVTAVPFVKVLLWLAIIDFLSGTMAAIGSPGDGLFGTQLKARIMVVGVMRKATMFMMVGGLYLVQQVVPGDVIAAIPTPVGTLAVHPANALCAALSTYEFVSSMENYIKLGGYVPGFIPALLEKWHAPKP